MSLSEAMEEIVFSRFSSIEEIEKFIHDHTGYYAKVIESESGSIDGTDDMLSFEIYLSEADTDDANKGSFDGEVYSLFYLKDNSGKYLITEY